MINGKYEQCYESCAECYGVGSEENHKCKVCKTGYSNLTKSNNCYQDCNNYYYFNESNHYICLTEDK